MIRPLLIGGAAAVLFAGAAMAQAQQSPSPPPPPAGAQGAGPGGFHHGFGGRRGFGRGFMGRERPSLEDIQKRNAEMFAKLDANRDGRATEAEFTAFLEQQRRERQHAMFQRFSGGSDSVTLDQLNARTKERYDQGPPGGGRRGPGGRGGPGQGGAPDGGR